MRTFRLIRNEDVSGVSGTGEIAEGVVFHDGQTVLSWFGKYHTIEIFPHVDDLIDIHGHGGKTELTYSDDPVQAVRNCTCDGCESVRDKTEIPEDCL
jgi:hypothetical protein